MAIADSSGNENQQLEDTQAAPILAEAPTPLDDFQRQCLIHDLSESEWEYWEELELIEKIHFRFFSIGLKSEHNWDEQPEGPLTIETWELQPTEEVQRLIDLGEGVPDAVGDATNFTLTPGEKDFFTDLSQEQKERFELFVYGLRARNHAQTLDGERTIREWRKASKDEIKALGDIARNIQRRKERLGKLPKRLRESNQEAHRYVKSNADRTKAKPPPTLGDWRDVNRALQQLKFPGDWTYEKTLYQNKNNDFQRVVHVFAQVDDAGNLVRRIVVKIQGYANQLNADILTRREYGIQHKLSGLNCPHILSCYGCSIRGRTTQPRALGYGYMEYAPWGDLRDYMNVPRLNNGQQIPEPYIWLVFRGLAEAVYLLQTGKTIAATEPQYDPKCPNDALEKVAHWQSIINLDIKGMNVVLGDAKAGWPAYKTPKMIDFGLCSYEPKWTKEQKKNLGTRGFKPPEQEWKPKTGRKDYAAQYDVDVHSHIFNVGLIIMGLMEGEEVTYDHDHQKAPRHEEFYDGVYTASLEKLVLKCVEIPPANRAKLGSLLHATRVGLEKWENIYGKVGGKSRSELPEFARAWFRDEERKIGDYFGAAWRVKKRRAEEDEKQDGTTLKSRLAPTRAALKASQGRGLKRPRTQPPQRLAGKENDSRFALNASPPLRQHESPVDLVDPRIAEPGPRPSLKRPTLGNDPPRYVQQFPQNPYQDDIDFGLMPQVPGQARRNHQMPQDQHTGNRKVHSRLGPFPSGVENRRAIRHTLLKSHETQRTQRVISKATHGQLDKASLIDPRLNIKKPHQNAPAAQDAPTIRRYGASVRPSDILAVPDGAHVQPLYSRVQNNRARPAFYQPRQLSTLRDMEADESARARAQALMNHRFGQTRPGPRLGDGQKPSGGAVAPPRAEQQYPVEAGFPLPTPSVWKGPWE